MICDVCGKTFEPITPATQTTCTECLIDNIYAPFKVALDQLDADGAFVSEEMTRFQILESIFPQITIEA